MDFIQNMKSLNLIPVFYVICVSEINRGINPYNYNSIITIRFWILFDVSIHSSSWKAPQHSCNKIGINITRKKKSTIEHDYNCKQCQILSLLSRTIERNLFDSTRYWPMFSKFKPEHHKK